MARRKHNAKGRGSNAPTDFIALERYLLRSDAWRSLSCLARAAYVEIAFHHTGSNNGSIRLSCQQVADGLQVSKDTAARALRELLARGFIEQAKGASFNCKIRHCAEWRLTAFRCDLTGNLPAKNFMRWTPEIQNTVRFTPRHGPTHRTVKENKPEKRASRYDPSDRQGQNRAIHGTTHRTLLESNHNPVSTSTGSSAGAAHRDASARRDPAGDEGDLKPMRDFINFASLAVPPAWPPAPPDEKAA